MRQGSIRGTAGVTGAIVAAVTAGPFMTAEASATAVTDNLVLELSAQLPGSDPENFWMPTISPAGVTGVVQEHSDLADSDPPLGSFGFKPTFNNDPTTPSYVFPNPTNMGAGQVGGFTDAFDYDYQDSFSLELWVKQDAFNNEAAQRSHLFGSAGFNDQGMQLVTRKGSGDTWGINFKLRDREGTNTVLGSFTNREIVPLGEWAHVVVNYDGSGADADAGTLPTAATYINGNMVEGLNITDNWPPPDGLDFTPEVEGISALGARADRDRVGSNNDASRMPFIGEISLLRIYGKALGEDEILANFAAGNGTPAIPEPASIVVASVGAVGLLIRRRRETAC